MSQENELPDEHLDIYADGSLKSADARVPTWLKWVYLIMPIWGVIWLFLYWNGSTGFLDRGHWFQLQKAANTTLPYINVDKLPPAESENPEQAK